MRNLTIEDVFTIGGYGFSEGQYFQTLEDARIDSFCDIRQRRGMRGPKYAFLNSRRLQDTLEKMGIAYAHLKEFAPTTEIRLSQKRDDESRGVQKRTRDVLGDAFLAAYTREILENRDVNDFLGLIPVTARRPCLFCVERNPAACHRSLVANWLADRLNVSVIHLGP